MVTTNSVSGQHNAVQAVIPVNLDSIERAERERAAEAEYQAVLWRDLLN
ncbi:hypothetical protein ES706_01726 [subsurface metagenome]